MVHKSLPVDWDSGVLSQAAGNFVSPIHFLEPERGCMGGGHSLEASWAFVGFCVGVPEVGGQRLGLGSALRGLGQIP